MVFYLGKDVSVYLTTENTTLGVSPKIDGSTNVVNTATATFAAKLAGTVTEVGDVTSLDLSIGAMDEDISYFGQRTALKAEIKKATSLTLTSKKSDFNQEVIWDTIRYGLTGSTVSDASIMSGLAEPTIEYGYRAYVHLSGTNEVMTIPNCVVQSHSVSINADGTTEQTLELMSSVTPVISGANYVTATDPADL
tara:strand:+ start:391 stop:972 length:582 start_codon:yes stop_codon:yes gene_type:complete